MVSGFNPVPVTSVGGATPNATGAVTLRATNIAHTGGGPYAVGNTAAANSPYGEIQFLSAVTTGFTAIENIVSRQPNTGQSGLALESNTSASRPPAVLGRIFFDTTLGIPIFYNGAAWVNSVGVVV